MRNFLALKLDNQSTINSHFTMKTKFSPSFGSDISPLKAASARLHSRITRQLTRGSSSHSAAHFDSSLSLFNSLWSPLRLDLLKAPISRHRE